jgi:serine protease Do
VKLQTICYTTTTVQGREKTVNAYCRSLDLAMLAVRLRFSLFDNDNYDGKGRRAGQEAPYEFADNRLLRGFGSGLLVTEEGHILTNHHVVKGAREIKVRTSTATLDASLLASDEENDLALLKIDGKYQPVVFADYTSARLGQTVFTVGFPMPDLQGFNPKVTKGVISGLSGLQDDETMYQIDASVQPGNSGGPLADDQGMVVGVVVARLNDAVLLKETGNIAQNVNYAIKKRIAMSFLDGIKGVDQLITTQQVKGRSFEDAVETVQKATVLIITY